MTYWHALLLAIVEGITEFLPVSSTGHMIIASALLGIPPTPFFKLYLVVIQLGAILSVFVVYYKRFFQSIDFYLKLLVAFLPIVLVGLLFKKHIDALLESVTTVAVMLVIGGAVLLFIDRWFPQEDPQEGGHPVTNPSFKEALIIGLFQCLAVVPGTSRSAATIIGGLTQKLTRRAAAEFAFFLAMPTMAAAAVKDIYDYYKDAKAQGVDVAHLFSGTELKMLALGNVVAFVVALLAIRLFVGFVARYGFRAFGIYRIIAGGILLIMLALKLPLNLV
ncbi:undecaprenyl-diphosphate phosphatase [Hymenobacter negativus]|uniref:Undecaprenyl-diphosphatase n=1 Tax=Hymenobacter negativus TaxID=2795026 RepID=A0ABS0Q825_9BACT|nr:MULTISPECIES: undecaprenyl-diphosphate phosphatase [Bacteria]MBH8558399.1 undecaprenyl-diphosphate phosphatase [Hymenobacter negativus]MBH8568889.1 undecaprenyl-diphosphate phosphatase [Hymenobacter negativus]MBR7208623.1 undecaprenyl-diphosphate phosphatase [Microvirga sp. STS02]